ncbi:MAG: UDP-N-acetylglucosamine 2-epimerase (non-hydrolyzing) [Planctomycetaceae bacterium]|nr:UDP-N-acetylglucosamine 2-epimerase (non-hydrolyzing) [Planctomycetaceae bacterium]
MADPVRLLAVFGTRPEAIKVAPIVLAARNRRDVDVIVCSTGQHREMLDQVVRYFDIQPDVDLNLMQPGQSLTGLASRCLAALEDTVAKYRPDVVLGQGDTTTAMCAGLTSFFNQLPFVHVEAGLRTDDIRSPFPEELNRRVCSLISTLHCAPTAAAAKNLLDEGYPETDVVVTGNTVIDALRRTVERERAEAHQWMQKHPELAFSRMVLITAHRRENHGSGIRNICSAVRELATRFPNVRFVYPVHLNPNICQPVHQTLSAISNLSLIAPADYPEFVWLMDQASLILTDSGGVQEEAPSLRKPVLVTRDTTERPEARDAGATRLVGTDPQRIIDSVSQLLTDRQAYAAMQIDTSPYGDGHASEIILDLTVERCRRSVTPANVSKGVASTISR